MLCSARRKAVSPWRSTSFTRTASARRPALSAHKPFENIYRHHRRYRITEGSEEIQMRKVAGHLFGFMGPNKGKNRNEPFDFAVR